MSDRLREGHLEVENALFKVKSKTQIRLHIASFVK